MNLKKHLNTDNLLLLIILLVGTILRFYNFNGLPLTYDEFSAYFRTQFNNFSDLIQYGVMTTDTHPPGVQVFLYYWIKISGSNEFLFKLPFLLSGVLSTFFAYKIAKEWFNPTVAIITAMFIAVLQYPITYSQMARPYSVGFLFALMMVWFWSRCIFKSDRKFYLNLFGFVLASAFCAYIHHFTLFFAGLVGISGLILIERKKLKYYVIALFLILILYLPNVPIFLVQLNEGGVEDWLSKPNPDFIINYFKYILHYSTIFYALIAVLIFLSFIYFSGKLKKSTKFRILAFSWFFVTFFVAYFYSIYINAVLQYSVLIFVFPFLVMFFFSYIRDIGPLFKTIVIFVFLFVAIYSLISDRQHYTMMYRMAYKEILVTDNKIRQDFGPANVSSVIHMPQKIQDFYNEKLSLEDTHIQDLDEFENYIQFKEYLNNLTSPYLVLAWTSIQDMEYLEIAQHYFPFIVQKHVWYKGDLYLLSKYIDDEQEYVSADRTIFRSDNKIENQGPGWEDNPEINIRVGINYEEDKIFFMRSKDEYSPKFSANLNDIIEKTTNVITFSIDAYTLADSTQAVMVCELYSDNHLIHWRSAAFTDFIIKPESREGVIMSLKLADMNLNYPEISIRCYIWNAGSEELYFDDFNIFVREGNPYIYGLFEKI